MRLIVVDSVSKTITKRNDHKKMSSNVGWQRLSKSDHGKTKTK